MFATHVRASIVLDAVPSEFYGLFSGICVCVCVCVLCCFYHCYFGIESHYVEKARVRVGMLLP